MEITTNNTDTSTHTMDETHNSSKNTDSTITTDSTRADDELHSSSSSALSTSSRPQATPEPEAQLRRRAGRSEPGTGSSDANTTTNTELEQRTDDTPHLQEEQQGQTQRHVSEPPESTAGDDNEEFSNARSEKGKEPADESVSKTNSERNDEFSCNICFDTATEPVLTICGHLFCWMCLIQWLERSATCPVCKAGCDKDKVIPVYGRGKEELDPRLNSNIPNRPAGHRPPPPPPRQHNQFFGFDPFAVPGSFHSMGMARTRSAGGGTVLVGGFAFLPALMGFHGFSGSTTTNGVNGVGGQPAGQQAFASRVFMMLAAMILMSIIFY